MDSNGHNSEVQRDQRSDRGFRLLTRFVHSEDKAEQVVRLWNKLRQDNTAFDDFTRENANVFLAEILNPMTELFIIGEEQGLLAAKDIVPGLSAILHCAVWDKELKVPVIIQATNELVEHLFETYKLARITVVAPVVNKFANRMALLIGFKYEGELRKAFLFDGVYHNLNLYGLLREEFKRREVTH